MFHRIDDLFTSFADAVTEFVGKWWFTAFSTLALLCWIGYGLFVLAPSLPSWFTSNAWNFPLNTITTVGEWFLEGLVLAAANRVEHRHTQVLHRIERLEEQHAHVLSHIERLVSVTCPDDMRNGE